MNSKTVFEPVTIFDKQLKSLQKDQTKGTRIKERKIEDAVVLVLKWRQLTDVTLKQGAEIIGVAKKSLDDYLLQLRLGRKYGFDFNKHWNSKIGILRSFNRRMKKKLKEGKFLAGRKRKDEEENYSLMIEKIIQEMHRPRSITLESDEDFKQDRMLELSLAFQQKQIPQKIAEGSQLGVKPVKFDQNVFHTENSEKSWIDFHYQEPENVSSHSMDWNPVDFSNKDLSFPGFEDPARGEESNDSINIHFWLG